MALKEEAINQRRISIPLVVGLNSHEKHTGIPPDRVIRLLAEGYLVIQHSGIK